MSWLPRNEFHAHNGWLKRSTKTASLLYSLTPTYIGKSIMPTCKHYRFRHYLNSEVYRPLFEFKFGCRYKVSTGWNIGVANGDGRTGDAPQLFRITALCPWPWAFMKKATSKRLHFTRPVLGARPGLWFLELSLRAIRRSGHLKS